MNARRKLEQVLTEYLSTLITDVPINAGRADGTVTTPYICISAETVQEQIRGSGIYLGDINIAVIVSSNDENTAAADAAVEEIMDRMIQLSNTLTDGNQVLADTALGIEVNGIAQIEQADAEDEEAFGDMLNFRIGFTDTTVQPALSPNVPPNVSVNIPPWWSGPVSPRS